jgi:FkbM family methyltransferase
MTPIRGGNAGLRSRIAKALIRRAGWPLSARSLERLRDAASYALGAGSATLSLEISGELKLLKELARRWSSRPQITVLDVGAYGGGYARAAMGAFGSRASIHCFEPQHAGFETLREELRSEATIHCHRLALGAAPGKAELFSDRASSPFASLHEETFAITGVSQLHREEVELDTLDRFAMRHGLTKIDLLKVDVEGHEIAVLQGATDLLERGAIEVIQFEFGERNLASRTYLKDFVDLLGPAYELFRLNARGLARMEYRPSSEVFLLEANYVAIRR